MKIVNILDKVIILYGRFFFKTLSKNAIILITNKER